MTDSKGRTVDFKNTLIIMTSNVGSSVIEKGGRNFGFFLRPDDEESESVSGAGCTGYLVYARAKADQCHPLPSYVRKQRGYVKHSDGVACNLWQLDRLTSCPCFLYLIIHMFASKLLTWHVLNALVT